MAWRIKTKKSAMKFLKSLPIKRQKVLRSKLETLLYALENSIPPHQMPGLDIKKLQGYRNRFRIRVGDLRIIVEINVEERTVLVTAAGKRENIYQ